MQKTISKMKTANIGDTIRIDWMDDEPSYNGRQGVVTLIDDLGQLHGTWGGLAIIPETDEYCVIKRKK